MRIVNPETEDDSVDEDDFDEIDESGVGEEDGEDLDEGESSESDDNSENNEDDEDVEGDEEDEGDEDDTGLKATSPTAKNIPGHIRERLEKDDAEIAELERKLGIKGRKTLPQAFKDDGLGDLLEPLTGDGSDDAETAQAKKRKAEAEEWLRSKRRKALGHMSEDSGDSDDDDDGDDGDDGDDSDDILNASDAEFGGFGSSDEDSGRKPKKKEAPKRQRENPYVAPTQGGAPAPQKYVPPALRRAQQGPGSESEVVDRVRRQAHHLIARLSDANMVTILGEVEKLYLDYPRQYVTEAVTDKLLEQVQIEGALSSNVVVLIAGFATALYMVKGADFGAHFLQQNASLFQQQYAMLAATDAAGAADAARDQHHAWAPSSKGALNLFGLLAELYNFRMVGPNLVYDYVRMLLASLTETNAELLLRVFETSGHRLRQDDPRALKDIVALLEPAAARAGGEKTLSARTRHMIDRIRDLRKGDKKKQRDAESSGFGHAERIRKVLSSLPTSRKLEAAGPLRVGLADIEQADKRGKWWLVGASWAGRGEPAASRGGGEDGEGGDEEHDGDAEKKKRKGRPASSPAGDDNDDDDDVLGAWGDDIADVEELDLLAREQGMNTDARRSIFVTLLSAADSKDAHARLLRLGLNKHEKREVANVLMRCVGSEQQYNRYYALVAQQVCRADRRMAWVFRASLWKLLRRTGEPLFGEAPEEDEADDEEAADGADAATDLRRLVHTAKLFGFLVARGSLGLDVLKCLSLVRLQAKARMFVEVLLLALFDEAHKAGQAGSDSAAVLRTRFRAAAGSSEDLRRGLQYFVERVVRKTTLVDDAAEARRVAKACATALKALRETEA